MKFCEVHNLNFDILNKNYNDMNLLKGDFFITIEKYDLINLIEQTRDKKFISGTDIGIISYHETPL